MLSVWRYAWWACCFENLILAALGALGQAANRQKKKRREDSAGEQEEKRFLGGHYSRLFTGRTALKTFLLGHSRRLICGLRGSQLNHNRPRPEYYFLGLPADAHSKTRNTGHTRWEMGVQNATRRRCLVWFCFARRSLEAVSEFVGSSHLRLVLGSGFPPTIFNIFATFRISTFSGLWSELASDVEFWREPFETNFKLRMSETATNRICGEKPRKQAAESALSLFLSSSPNSTKPMAALVKESHGPSTNVSERCNVIPYTHFALLEMIDSNSRF